MLLTSTKSKSFKIYSETNNCKINSIIQKAQNILKYKQLLSPIICSDFLNFLDLTKIDFIKKYNSQNPKNISGQDAQKALEDVYTSYENKKESAINKIKFQTQKYLKFEYYKKNTKDHKKGTTKHCSVILQETKLTKVCTYLAKYYNENIEDYLRNKIISNEKLLINEIDKAKINKLNNQKIFYSEIIKYIEKYGSRIVNLALNRRNNVLKQVTEFPINFQSLTFRSVNRIKHEIIARNKNHKSKYNAFIIFGGFGDNNKEKIEIPTKYSEEFHGKLNKYTSKNTEEGKEKKQWDTAYTIVFKDTKPIKLVLTIDVEEKMQTNKINYLGVDTNIKHNLFCTSENEIIDYNRNLIDDFCKFVQKIDKAQQNKKLKNKNNRKYSKKQLRNLDYKTIRIEDMIKRKCSELVKKAKRDKKDHIIIEDLGQFARGFTKSDEFEGIKFTRLIHLLSLANVKNIVKSIGNKNEIEVTWIQPEYTSKTCSKCGNIDDNNRKSQEIFCCTECGFTVNADYNASINILNRLVKDVLRLNLLRKTDFGFEPKKVKKEVIREFIELTYSFLKDDCVEIKI